MAAGNALRKTYIEVDAQVGGALAGLSAVQSQSFGTTRSMQSVYGAQRTAVASTRTLQRAFYGLAAGAAAATGALYLLARQGSRVDLVFAEMRATAGATMEQMERVRKKSQQLGAELPTTLMESAQAFREMSYAGYSAEEAIAAATGVVYLAETAGIGMSQAARIATSNLNAFRLEAEKANAVANALAGTFASSAVTIEEVGKSLEYASAAAYQAGQSMTQTTAAIGILGDVGLRASKAGVGMQQFFTRLAAPSGKAEEALAELNLTTQDFIDKEGGFKSIYEIIQVLSGALRDVPEAEKIRLLTEIFQTRGMRAVAPLVSNVDKLNEKIEQVAASEIAGAIDSFGELSDTVRQTRQEEVNKLLERFNAVDQLDITIQPGMSTEEYVKQIQTMRDVLSEQEIMQVLEAQLDIEEQAARILAGDIAGGAATEDLVAGLNQATTAGEITAAKIDTVAGQVEYLSGSISSFAYTAYRTLEPLFYTIGHLLTGFADLMNSNALIAQTFGVALLGLAAALATAAGYTGAYIAVAKVHTAVMAQEALAAQLVTASEYAQAGAKLFLKYATWLLTASTTALIGAAWTRITTTWAQVTASYAAATAELTLAGATSTLTSALYALWVALGPIGWLVLGISGVFLAWKLGILDWLGVAGPLESLLADIGTTLGWLWGWLELVAAGFGILIDMGIEAAVWGIAGAFDAAIGFVMGLVNWFDRLSTVGKIVMAPFFTIIYVFWVLLNLGSLLAATWDILVEGTMGLIDAAVVLYEWYTNLSGATKALITFFFPLFAIVEGTVWAFEMLTGALDDADEGMEALGEAGEDLLGVLDGIHSGLEDVADWIIEFFENPGQALDKAYDLGANIAAAIARGIYDSPGIIEQAVQDAVAPDLPWDDGGGGGDMPPWMQERGMVPTGGGGGGGLPPRYGGGPNAGAATAAGGTSAQQVNNAEVNQSVEINVDGADDPEETARAVNESTPNPEETRKEVEYALQNGLKTPLPWDL